MNSVIHAKAFELNPGVILVFKDHEGKRPTLGIGSTWHTYVINRAVRR